MGRSRGVALAPRSSRAGFTVGTKIPGIGLSASNKKQSLAESAGFFYATGLAGLPLLSLGYRF